jgi:hypothetical protein
MIFMKKFRRYYENIMKVRARRRKPDDLRKKTSPI